MTMVGAGAKFGKGTYKVSAGLHGMGAKAVTALSEWTEAQVQRNGRTYMQEYERGKAVSGGPRHRRLEAHRHARQVQARPGNLPRRHVRLRHPGRSLARIGLPQQGPDAVAARRAHRQGRGLQVRTAAWPSSSNTSTARKRCIHPPIHIEKTVDQVAVEVAMQYTRGEEERNRCYTNNAFNSIGGTHLSGFRTALTRTLNNYGAKEELFKNVSPIGEDFREGLTVVISVQVPEPQFDSQEKKRLNNLEVEGIVAGVVSRAPGQVPGGEPQGRRRRSSRKWRWRRRPARRRPRPKRR